MKLMQKSRKVAVCFLVMAWSLSLSMTAPGSIQPPKTVVKAATKQTINLKAASDFTLKLPANWKGNYVKKSSKDKKHGSYVVFYAKKCYKQTKEGWLFSIVRYKDDSYTDMPAYELAGKWNGVSYVAVFPTDVQFEGASKKAVKQYQTLNKSVEKVVRSIAPKR